MLLKHLIGIVCCLIHDALLNLEPNLLEADWTTPGYSWTGIKFLQGLQSFYKVYKVSTKFTNGW